jgi:hypothetical protein
MDEMCCLLHENSKEILRLRIELSKNDEEREFLKRQFDKLNEKMSKEVYEETRVIEKFHHLYTDLVKVERRREADLGKMFKGLENLEEFTKEELDKLYREKIKYLLYLNGQDSRLRDEIISELKGELILIASENSNLKKSLMETDHELLREQANNKLRSELIERYMRLSEEVLNAIKQENRRVRVSTKKCENCRTSASVISACQKVMSDMSKIEKEYLRAEEKVDLFR